MDLSNQFLVSSSMKMLESNLKKSDCNNRPLQLRSRGFEFKKKCLNAITGHIAQAFELTILLNTT